MEGADVFLEGKSVWKVRGKHLQSTNKVLLIADHFGGDEGGLTPTTLEKRKKEKKKKEKKK